MPNLFDVIKRTIAEKLVPGTAQRLGEIEALRQMYSGQNTALLPNTLYRIHGATTGSVVGFSFICNCTREYQMVSFVDWTRDYECKTCHAKFNVYRLLGAIDASGRFLLSAQEIQEIVATLPVRPRLHGQRQSPFHDTWGNSNDETVSYDGAHGKEYEHAFRRNDPAVMGPGF